MQTYAPTQTVKDKMHYHLACFLLHDLARQGWIAWQEADRAHERVSFHFNGPSQWSREMVVDFNAAVEQAGYVRHKTNKGMFVHGLALRSEFGEGF